MKLIEKSKIRDYLAGSEVMPSGLLEIERIIDEAHKTGIAWVFMANGLQRSLWWSEARNQYVLNG